MIRPYLAVIGDSFRAAFSSRVLWVALAAIYLFLFALAPIGYHEVFTTTVRWFDLADNGTRMKAMLARALVEPGGEEADPGRETPAGRIARNLPAELQRDLRKVAEGQEVRIHLDIFASGFNELLDSEDWYDESIWQKAPRRRELRELDEFDESELTEELRRRRARLRIEAALPGVFENRGARSIALTYGGYTFPAVFQFEKPQFLMLLNHFALRLIIDWVLGFAMIFLGILVTAGIIPEMLQPGSLHLLLSKPVSRWGLFLAKFVGGCAFVFLCISQLIIGLWLISGLRLDIWNARLFLCIPVCVFLFAVFYSVSAVAGLRWRSPILAIGLANLFGAGCWLIGIAATLSDSFVTRPDRVTGLTVSGDAVVASTQGGKLRRLDQAENRWVDLLADDSGRSDRIIPPVTLSDGRIVTARVRGGRLNLFGSGVTPLLVIDNDTPETSIELPTGIRGLRPAADGAVLTYNSGDVMIAEAEDLGLGSLDSEHDADAAVERNSDDESADDSPPTRRDEASAAGGMGGWLPRLLKMMGGPSEGFYSILPERTTLLSPSAVAVGRGGEHVYVFSGGRLMRLQRPAGSNRHPWRVAASVEAASTSRSVSVFCTDDAVLLLRNEEPPLLFSDMLEPIFLDEAVAEKVGDMSVAAATGCPEVGIIALVSGTGRVWLLQRHPDDSVSLRPLSRSSGVEAIHWDAAEKKLWAAHHVDRISAWDLSGAAAGDDPRRPAITYRPAVGGWRMLDRYVVAPLRTVTPQTGELGDTIATIVSGENTLQMPFASPGDAEIQRYNVWRPVLTCGGFIIFMLTLGCVYFARVDF